MSPGHAQAPAPRPHVVAVGGGHGLARLLGALRRLPVERTAVVTAADDGGSSGRLRREHGIVPPGDARRALLALAREERLASLLAHRFGAGDLQGHALGNLVLLALAERRGGDVVAALDEAGTLLGCVGRVRPATRAPVRLCGQVGDEVLVGQAQLTSAGRRIGRVWLDPPAPPACVAALEALAHADLVVLGPGSLFTSVIATLLVPAVAEAVAAAPRVAHVLNVSTQPGETRSLSADEHLAALRAHVPGLVLDPVIVHDGPPAPPPAEPLGAEVRDPIARTVRRADLLARREDGSPGRVHDEGALAAVLADVLGVARSERAARSARGQGTAPG